jgi:FkbM family methyltransferase
MTFSVHSSRQLLRVAHRLVDIQNILTKSIVVMGFRDFQKKLYLERVGTVYGGWWSPVQTSSDVARMVLISAGLGFDTSFDKEMARRGYFVIGLDPSLASCQLARSNLGEFSGVRVLNKGLSTYVGQQVFYEPKKDNDSWSTLNLHEAEVSASQSFEVTTLDQLFSENTELENADFRFLKMDIEGSELSILENNISSMGRFDFIGIEMDFLSLIAFLNIRTRVSHIIRARRILKAFKIMGYSLVKTENFNFFWKKKDVNNH